MRKSFLFHKKEAGIAVVSATNSEDGQAWAGWLLCKVMKREFVLSLEVGNR